MRAFGAIENLAERFDKVEDAVDQATRISIASVGAQGLDLPDTMAPDLRGAYQAGAAAVIDLVMGTLDEAIAVAYLLGEDGAGFVGLLDRLGDRITNQTDALAGVGHKHDGDGECGSCNH